MPTITELGDALVRADAAGDEQAARAIVAEIDRLQGQQTAAPESSGMAEYGGALVRGLGPTAIGAGTGLLMGGVPGAVTGAATVETGGLVGDLGLSAINAMLGTRITTPSEGWKALFDKMGVPEVKGEGAKMLESGARAVGTTLGTLGLGGLIKGSATKGIATVGEILASAPRQQLVGAAVGGVAAEGSRALAEDMGASPGMQAAASLIGGLSGGAIGGIIGAERNTVTAATNPIVQAYEQLGLKTPTTSEVREPTTLFGKLFRTMGANIPLIGGAAREEARAHEISQGLHAFLNTYQVTHGATAPFATDVVENLLKTRGAKLTQLVGDKNAILDGLSATGTAVPVPNAMRQISQEIAAISSLNNPELAPIVSKFQNIASGISRNTLRNVDSNLELTGTLLKDPNLASISKQGQPAAKRIYDAIREDMGNFIENTAGTPAKDAWIGANKELSGMVDELGNLSLKKALKTGEANPDAVGRMLLDTKNPESFNRIIAGLDSTGKNFAKQSILQSIANQATDSATGNISPNRFRNSLNNLDQNITKLFTSDEKKMLDAWATVIESSKFSRFFAPDAPTGVRTIVGTTLTAMGSMVIPKVIFGAAAHHIYESRQIRDILLKISGNPANKDALIAQAAQMIPIAAVKDMGTSMIKKGIPITFDPENSKSEQVGQGTVTTDIARGYRAISTNGTKQRLYSPDNKLIGVFADLDQARKYADMNVIKSISIK
jgi:hypothetical protein